MPRYVSNREAARRLEVHPNTIRNWVDAGVIRADISPTGVRRILAADVEFLERRMSDEGEPASDGQGGS